VGEEVGETIPHVGSEIALERWERAKTEISFKDMVEEILTKDHAWKLNGNKINCPFHGTDSTPSFTLYEDTNSASCYGCPGTPRDQFYDNVKFVSMYFNINRVMALEWIEKHYKLPRIANQTIQEEDEDEEDEDVKFTVKDLSPAYLALAPTLVESVADAKSLIKKYFLAFHQDDPLFLARVLGRKRLESIKVSGRISR
jgi:hypothetical protein